MNDARSQLELRVIDTWVRNFAELPAKWLTHYIVNDLTEKADFFINGVLLPKESDPSKLPDMLTDHFRVILKEGYCHTYSHTVHFQLGRILNRAARFQQEAGNPSLIKSLSEYQGMVEGIFRHGSWSNQHLLIGAIEAGFLKSLNAPQNDPHPCLNAQTIEDEAERKRKRRVTAKKKSVKKKATKKKGTKKGGAR